MHTTALLRTVKRMTDRLGRPCPECSDWPDEVALLIIEEVVEPDAAPVPPAPPARNPWDRPCGCCGRRHRPRVIAFEEVNHANP
jgi:hypothetical protein